VLLTKLKGRDARLAYEVQLPPIAEQRRIADILDKADAIRRKRKEAIALTEDLLRSAFLDMFGDIPARCSKWPFRPLREFLSARGVRRGACQHFRGVFFAFSWKAACNRTDGRRAEG
jgi:hypothetical protein